MNVRQLIMDAAASGPVTITYTKYGGEVSTRTISDIKPSLEFGEGYIDAFCHLRNERRTFRLDRVRGINGKPLFHVVQRPVETGKKVFVPQSEREETPIRHPAPRSKPLERPLPKYVPGTTPKPKRLEPVLDKPASRNEGCYIATMAYGDYDHPQVLKLREYRDRTLMQSAWGRSFVKGYYAVSPHLVRQLKDCKHINRCIRWLLDACIHLMG